MEQHGFEAPGELSVTVLLVRVTGEYDCLEQTRHCV